MIQQLTGAVLKELPEVARFMAKQSAKILPAVASAAGVAIYEEYSKYRMKRKLHKLYYNAGFKDGFQTANEKLQQKIDEIIHDKTLDDQEKVKRLKKYHKIIDRISKEKNQFKKECEAIQNNKNLSEAEKNKKLEELHNKYFQKLSDLGIDD